MEIGRGIFVTGTDTHIGKTVVSALLVATLREKYPVRYWKPVQTGIESDCDTSTVELLARCSENEIHRDGIRLERPLSPHLSARIAGVEFGVEDIIRMLPKRPREEFWIVEGAGGVLVPLNETELMIDLIVGLGLPAVVVSQTGLGTINHSLLTIESIRSRGIEVYGIIMNGHGNEENSAAICKYGRVPILAEIPVLDPLTPESIAKYAESICFEF